MASILIVEDERIVAKDLQSSLIEMGYDPYAVASSGDEALEAAGRRCPDIVLMDIRIKGKRDGIEVSEIMRQTCRTAVIFLTAHADGPMVDRAKLTGPYGYLVKPVKTAELRSTIEITLYRRQFEAARERAALLESQIKVLEETSRMKDRIIGNIAHEIRTPLNAVLGFSSLMHEGMAGDMAPQHREFLGHVLASGRRLLRILNDILELASLEAGKVTLEPADIDLPQLVDEVMGLVTPELDGKGHRILIDIDPACRTVRNDRRLLSGMLYSYLSNAAKFTPPGGDITLRAAPAGEDSLRLEVTDTGAGISQEEAGRLFVTFGQLDSSLQRAAPGAGLGLVLAKRMAEAQGGCVGVDSAAGGGATFFAVLPASRPPVKRNP